MKNNETSSSKLSGKDLINAGIFSAVYVVIIMVIACTIGMIPIGYLLLTFIIPFVGGIPMMLYLSKIKKFGMLMILQIVIGLTMIVTGVGYTLLIWAVITGLVGELILKMTQYRRSTGCVLAYAVSSICIAGNYMHWLNASEEWLAETAAAGYGEAYMSTVDGYIRIWWVFPGMIVLCFLGGLLGGLLGRKIMKKHFERSGLV